MRKYIILLFTSISIIHLVVAQEFTSEEKRKETENILNVIINSTPFDSIYKECRVYFLENELLKKKSSLILKKEKCTAKILSKCKIKNKLYVVLGDFTIDWNNPTSARVQLEIMPNNQLLNMVLKKEEDIWVINNYVIMDN